MDLSDYRQQAMDFLNRFRLEKYRHHAGLKDSLEVEPIYQGFKHLWTDLQITDLKDLSASASPDEEKPLRFLLTFAVNQAINFEVISEDQSLANQASQATLQVAGREVGFHHSHVLLANEKDRSMRRDIHEKRLEILSRSNPLRIQRLEKMNAKSSSLFPGTYADLYQKLTRVNFRVLATQLENFLVASESYYSSHLERCANQFLGTSSDDLMPWDIDFLFRGHAYDRLFPQDRMLSVLKRTLMGLGFDLKKIRNIIIDSAERPSKSSSPACVPVRVPEEVYLVIRPQGGMPDFLDLLNKAGQAMHAAHISEKECFEYRYLGDSALPETFSFLFQYLTLNQDWLQDFIRLPYENEFRDFNQLRKLYLLRASAARFLFEVKLHAGQLPAGETRAETYAQSLSRALHFRVAPESYVSDIEDAFKGTRFLRAWIFESEIREILINRFGNRWYSRPIAGDFLKDVWQSGLRYSCDELAQRIRNWGLSMDPITRDFVR